MCVFGEDRAADFKMSFRPGLASFAKKRKKKKKEHGKQLCWVIFFDGLIIHVYKTINISDNKPLIFDRMAENVPNPLNLKKRKNKQTNYQS